MKWIDEDLTPVRQRQRPQINVRRLVEELTTQPGRWAEVDRYPLDRYKSAYSRGSQTVKRYPVLQYAVEQDGDEFVLYFRVHSNPGYALSHRHV